MPRAKERERVCVWGVLFKKKKRNQKQGGAMANRKYGGDVGVNFQIVGVAVVSAQVQVFVLVVVAQQQRARVVHLM